VITKMGRVYGSSMQGLIDFLFEPGVRAAHTDPHVVAAYEPVVVGDRAGTAVARKMLAMDLDNPRVMLVPEVTEKFVIDVTVTAAPEDGVLHEDTRRAIAESIAEHLGFDEDTPGTPVRWVGVHHGVTRNGHDHIHLATNRVAEDGRMHRFPRPPGVMLNEVRQNTEIVHGLRRVGHRPRVRQAS